MSTALFYSNGLTFWIVHRDSYSNVNQKKTFAGTVYVIIILLFKEIISLPTRRRLFKEGHSISLIIVWLSFTKRQHIQLLKGFQYTNSSILNGAIQARPPKIITFSPIMLKSSSKLGKWRYFLAFALRGIRQFNQNVRCHPRFLETQLDSATPVLDIFSPEKRTGHSRLKESHTRWKIWKAFLAEFVILAS